MIYKSWVHPLSDYGVEILGEGGIFTEYPFHYQDEKEMEEERMNKVRDSARLSLANNPKLFGFTHPQQSMGKKFLICSDRSIQLGIRETWKKR